MKKANRFAFCILTALILLLTACGGNNATPATTTATTTATATEGTTAAPAEQTPSWKTDNSPFTVNWYVDLSFWKWKGASEWGGDLVSSIIKEKTGAAIKFITPATDDGQQLTTMVASNSLPDMITLGAWWSPRSRTLDNKLATEGMLYSYNELMDKYAPTMWNTIRKDVFGWYAEKDGKTYIYPDYAYSNQDLAPGEHMIPNGCITVRKDLWEAIGSPDMSTPEGYLAACKKVMDEVKTYNGKPIIPIQLYEGVGNSMLWLSEYFATPYEDADGNYLYDILQPQYKAAMKFLNTAYRQGFISNANFSDTRDKINENFASGRVFTQITAPQDFLTQMQTLYTADPKAAYVPFVFRGYEGQDPVLMDSRGMGYLTTSITKNAKQPDRCIKLIEYLISEEGTIDTMYGKEGITFDWVDNHTKIKVRQEQLDDAAKNNSAKYAVASMYLLDNYAMRRKWDAEPTDPMTLATADIYIKKPMAQYAFDMTAAGLKLDPAGPNYSKYQDMDAKIAAARYAATAQIIVAKTDAEFESRYNALVDELKGLGLDEIIAYKNEGFQAAKKALGQERSWAPLLNK